MTYKGWTVSNFLGSVVPVRVGGVASKSPPNRIITGIDVQLTQGSKPTFLPAAPFNKISLYDFYFGDSVRTEQPAVVVATKCTISVEGFAAKTNQQVASAFFTFNPPLELTAPAEMALAHFDSDFAKPLSMVTVEVVDDAAVKAMQLDDLSYAVST